jgi:hypothetical protein
MRDDSVDQRVATAQERHARLRVGWETVTAIEAVLADPAVRRVREEIEREEARLGIELHPRFQVFQDRYDAAKRRGDFDLLSRTCAGKHGRYGRMCVLVAGHEATEPHWGVNSAGQPVAWVGSAPDDA